MAPSRDPSLFTHILFIVVTFATLSVAIELTEKCSNANAGKCDHGDEVDEHAKLKYTKASHNKEGLVRRNGVKVSFVHNFRVNLIPYIIIIIHNFILYKSCYTSTFQYSLF